MVATQSPEKLRGGFVSAPSVSGILKFFCEKLDEGNYYFGVYSSEFTFTVWYWQSIDSNLPVFISSVW